MPEDNFNRSLILNCAELLIRENLSIAFAESASAGRFTAEFSLAPQAGKFLKGGLACYDASLKESLLGVPKEQVLEFTPESSVVTRGITYGLQKLIPADIHVGCTGLTCAGGSETPEKPVGTMFICAIKGNDILFERRLYYPGVQEDIVLRTLEETAWLLTRHLDPPFWDH